MRIFGLDPNEVRRAVAPVTPSDYITAPRLAGTDPNSEAAERFARAVWTGIAEPGDGTAGSVISALGASVSLQALIEKWSPERIVRAANTENTTGRWSDAPVEEIQKAVARWLPRLDSSDALAALRLAVHHRATLLVPGDREWPERLNDLASHAPIALWVRGDPLRLRESERSISLVGARAATGYGEHVTVEAASALVGRGFAIISGAAYGIDGAAHRAALAAEGTTVAFLAGGVDRPYPSGHDALLARIVETGVVLSEIPCGGSPTKWRFLQRNRLIAALSQATVVLEAGWRSGSLNTAGHAAALGRPLGAVPGAVTSAASAGCHRLIREYGATCVTNAEEMAELVEDTDREGELSGWAGGGAQHSADELRVLDALSTRTGRTIDEIAKRSGMPVETVQSVLGVLQLEGTADERQFGWVYVTQRF